MESFDKVSLGFAEFISQLLKETFDASLYSQNHQIEQYAELEKSLSLPDEVFFELYLSDDLILSKEQDIFNLNFYAKMPVDENILEIIRDIFGNESGIVHNKKITQKGLQILRKYIKDILISEKRESLNFLINKSEMTRLVIDSGEIRAKLELSNFTQTTSRENVVRPFERREDIETLRRRDEDTVEDPEASEIFRGVIAPARRVNLNGVLIDEVIDPTSKMKIIMINKESIKLNKKIEIPVRVIAKPITSNSNSNLFSEVIIRFKTV